MKSPVSARSSRIRRLLTVQTVAGVALLALAVPYSGCFTPALWKNESLIMSEKYEGRTYFAGSLAKRYVNEDGDLAYPGRMFFTGGSMVNGALIISASKVKKWNDLLGLAPSPSAKDSHGEIKWNPGMVKIAESAESSPFQNVSFYPLNEPSSLTESGYKLQVVPPFSKPDRVGSTELHITFDQSHQPIFPQIVNTTGKVVLTPVTVVMDVILVGGGIIAKGFGG